MERTIDLSTSPYTTWSWNHGWGALPLVAVLGSAWAFARPFTSEQLPALLLAVGLVLAGWGPLWYTILATDWATPLRRWRDWQSALPTPALPYTLPQTPGARLHQRVAQARAWWQQVGAAHLAAPLRAALLALAVSLLLSAALGRDALMLTGLFFACSQLAALWCEGRGQCVPGWEGLALVGLPWFLGATLGQGTNTLPALSALVLALLVGLYGRPSYLTLGGPLLATGFLIWHGNHLAAGILLLLALPGCLHLLQRTPLPDYRRAIGLWVLAMLLLMAWVL